MLQVRGFFFHDAAGKYLTYIRYFFSVASAEAEAEAEAEAPSSLSSTSGEDAKDLFFGGSTENAGKGKYVGIRKQGKRKEEPPRKRFMNTQFCWYQPASLPP